MTIDGYVVKGIPRGIAQPEGLKKCFQPWKMEVANLTFWKTTTVLPLTYFNRVIYENT